MKQSRILIVAICTIFALSLCNTAWGQGFIIKGYNDWGWEDSYTTTEVDSITFTERNCKNGYNYVDLGLPSGVLWATKNVGAVKEREPGHMFAFGETETKDNFSKNNYKFYDAASETYTKYSYYNKLTELLPEDDAATANWRSPWRIPTVAEYRELKENTTASFRYNMSGGVYIVTLQSKKNGNSIKFILPEDYNIKETVYFATQSINIAQLEDNSQRIAFGIKLYGSTATLYIPSLSRELGAFVRPVLAPENAQQ